MGRHALDHEPLGEQLRQGAREPAPPFVLEALDRKLDRTFIGDGRPQPGKRFEAGAAAALPLG